MFIFQNTSGGTYEWKEYGKPVTYIFPKGASINLGGVKLDISNLKVECHGGKIDEATNAYFAEVVSKVPPASRNIINSNIFISDNDISGCGYPRRGNFNQCNIDYLSDQEFKHFQDSLKQFPKGHPDVIRLEKIIHFLQKWAETNRNAIKHQLNSILNENNIFPKNISVIYDDRKLKHTTHIVLEYKSKEKCILNIDNTHSIAHLFGEKFKEELKEQSHIDITEAKESFSSQKPNFIKFHSKDNPVDGDVELEMQVPIEQILFQEFYIRMATMLKKLDIPIQNIVIHSSPYNQKLTEECVPFSIQNKLNFIEQRKYDSDESVFENGARVRAEQAVIACLLEGSLSIPRFNEQDCKDKGLDYKEEHWYPNYSEVFNNLKKIISNASLEELKALYMAIDLDGCLSLAPSYKPFLLECMELKMDLSNYSVVGTEVDKVRGQFLHEQLAPSLIFQKNTHTLFASKDYLAQVDRKNLDDAIKEGLNP